MGKPSVMLTIEQRILDDAKKCAGELGISLSAFVSLVLAERCEKRALERISGWLRTQSSVLSGEGDNG